MAGNVDAPGRLLIRLGIRLPEVFVNLACFDVVAKGYLLTLLEHDPFSHGGAELSLLWRCRNSEALSSLAALVCSANASRYLSYSTSFMSVRVISKPL